MNVFSLAASEYQSTLERSIMPVSMFSPERHRLADDERFGPDGRSRRSPGRTVRPRSPAAAYGFSLLVSAFQASLGHRLSLLLISLYTGESNIFPHEETCTSPK